MLACMQTYIHTYTHAHMHTCIHTYIHTYIHVCIQFVYVFADNEVRLTRCKSLYAHESVRLASIEVMVICAV